MTTFLELVSKATGKPDRIRQTSIFAARVLEADFRGQP